MKILYTITRYWPAIGGAENHLRENIKRLPAGTQVKVKAFWKTNRTDWLWGTTLGTECFAPYYDEPAKIEPLCFSLKEKARLLIPTLTYYPGKAWSLVPMTQALEPQLASEDFDLIHNARIGREAISLASYNVARAKDKPFVFTPVHHPRWVGWFYKQYLDLYRRADALIAITEVERQILIQLGVKPERVFVRGIGAIVDTPGDGAAFRERYKLEDAPLILFLGQKYPYKGYDALLQATTKVWQKYPNARFAFLGPRTKASQRVFAGISDKRILELDKVSTQEKSDALAACDIFCVPSSQESFGGVYLEAWAFAKPVIGCDIPAVREVISDGEDGLLVSQQPESIARAILSLLEDEPARQRMGQNGLSKTRGKYSWETSTQQLLAAYDAVLH